MKMVTMQAGDVKVTIGYDEETDAVESLRLDIATMDHTNLSLALMTLEEVIKSGTKELGHEED